MNDVDLTRYIRDVPDFPTAGVLFRDITPLLGDPAAFARALDLMSDSAAGMRAEAIVGIESRGFLFGTPIAARLGLPFVPLRKAGKLPAASMSVEYSLEYGDAQLDVHADALTPCQRAVIIDDVLATGGTARAAAQLVELVGGVVAGIVFLIEISALGGRQHLRDYDIRTFVQFE